MVRIKCELGLTLKMASGNGYNFFRPLNSIEDIDPEGDVEAQIEVALVGLRKVNDAVEQEIIRVVESSDMIDKESIVIEMKKQLIDFEQRMLTVEQASNNLSLEDGANNWTPKKRTKS